MFRPLLIGAALFGLAAPALAETAVSATPGALAGRSPHHLFVAADRSTASCGKTMHSLPAGKPHTYGRHVLPAQPCEATTIASNAPTSPVAGN